MKYIFTPLSSHDGWLLIPTDTPDFQVYHPEYGPFPERVSAADIAFLLDAGELKKYSDHLAAQLYGKVSTLRVHQRDFFKYKKREMLKICRIAERELDLLLTNPDLDDCPDELLLYIRKMRTYQADYFKYRQYQAFQNAQFYEQEVDGLLAKPKPKSFPTNQQLNLFR